MARGRVRIFGQPDEYVSLSRARWLIAARRARFLSSGELHILHGTPHSERTGKAKSEAGSNSEWTAFSGGRHRHLRTRWLNGFRMNGDIVNKNG